MKSLIALFALAGLAFFPIVWDFGSEAIGGGWCDTTHITIHDCAEIPASGGTGCDQFHMNITWRYCWYTTYWDEISSADDCDNHVDSDGNNCAHFADETVTPYCDSHTACAFN